MEAPGEAMSSGNARMHDLPDTGYPNVDEGTVRWRTAGSQAMKQADTGMLASRRCGTMHGDAVAGLGRG